MRKPPRSPEDYAAKYPALAKRRHRPPVRTRDYTTIMLGHDQDGAPVILEEAARMEHCLVVGATGSGKTTLLKNLVMQDFRRGRGGIVFDPHGSHPGSLFHEIIDELDHDGFFETGRVHIINPNLRDHVVPINFLARLAGTDISVLADALLQAVGRVWGDKDSHQNPTIRSVLKGTFTALTELGLPLTDARYLFDPHDTYGLRARVIKILDNEFARGELERLHQTALDERSKRDFRAQVVGPINRINEFISSDAIRTMLGVVDEPGQPRRTLDLLEIMDKGDILLVNLQHGPAVSEADTTLLGALLLRYIFLLSSRRTNLEPFPLIVDEAYRFLTGDIPNLLAEIRKWSVGGLFSIQFLGQLGKPDDLIYQACLNSTEVKIVFRVKSPKEAQELAEMVIPLNLERPIAASVRPTAIGQRRVNLASRASSRQEATSEGEAESVAKSYAVTQMRSRGEAIGTMTSTSSATGEFSTMGDSAGMVMTPTPSMFGPNAANASLFPFATSQSFGESMAQGSSQQSASSIGNSSTTIETQGEAETQALSRAESVSRSRSQGTAETTGEHEAYETIYADLPGSFHSKENELYRAGELLRALPIGRAFASWRGKSVCITIPPPKKKS